MSSAGPTFYFDYNATTPLDPSVREAMLPFLDSLFGNPSSFHRVGRQVRVALDEARECVAATLVCKPSDIIFTSGGTEANNHAIWGAARARRHKGRHLITSAIEHPAVLESFKRLEREEEFRLTILEPEKDGRVDPERLRASFRPDTILVSVMAANNEIGTIQPIAEIGAICRSNDIVFHTDAVQWFGKLPLNGIDQFNADLVTLCSHKFHGPKGAGLLYSRSSSIVSPLLVGGSQEGDRRAGTENAAAIMGLAAATSGFVRDPVFSEVQMRALSARLIKALEEVPGVILAGSRAERLPNTVAVTVTGADSTSLLAGLDLAGICASSGSACSSGSLTPSHVLLSMGVPRDLASSLVRFSLGRENTGDQVDYVGKEFQGVVRRIREASAAV